MCKDFLKTLKRPIWIGILTIIALLAIAISLLGYFIYHSKNYEVASISTLNTTTMGAVTISNGNDNDNSQLTTGFTTKTNSTNQFNNPTTSTSYAVKDSTSNIPIYTLVTVPTKTVQSVTTTTPVNTGMSTTMGIGSTQVTNIPSSIEITSTMMGTSVQTSTSNQSVFSNFNASLSIGRSNFGSVLLANGQVLVAGGFSNSSTVTSRTEVYTSTGWQIATLMKVARGYHTATAFANNIKILAAGGGGTVAGFQTAEVYDFVHNTWTFTSNNMSSSRFAHTATLLANGQILIAGGANTSGKSISACELYIPSSNSFINTTNMNIARFYFTSTLLSDGSTVLVTGGVNTSNSAISSAEYYINGSWILLSNSMTQTRALHAAVLLNDGTVLVVGGSAGAGSAYLTADIYNPATKNFTAVGSMQYRRAAFTLTLLPSGKVLAVGGADLTTSTYPLVCELYDPVTRTWSNTTMLNHGRSYHQSVLTNTFVLTMGGNDGTSYRLSSSEIYNF
ncbi:unnamed protein product [Adineta steineri]|uniref:Kelch repeat protein n=1 Tax=Adineta steineri TaxID=433720 RepID=A0A814YML9_9BILA|nr:unnamed protein product [Adineta steineri]CAF1527926.1 unnamed protein product [Adineta steineri]